MFFRLELADVCLGSSNSGLTLDLDAKQLLRELCPSKKAHGRFLSELIRTEQRIREERQRVRAALAGVLEETYGEMALP